MIDPEFIYPDPVNMARFRQEMSSLDESTYDFVDIDAPTDDDANTVSSIADGSESSADEDDQLADEQQPSTVFVRSARFPLVQKEEYEKAEELLASNLSESTARPTVVDTPMEQSMEVQDPEPTAREIVYFLCIEGRKVIRELFNQLLVDIAPYSTPIGIVGSGLVACLVAALLMPVVDKLTAPKDFSTTSQLKPLPNFQALEVIVPPAPKVAAANKANQPSRFTETLSEYLKELTSSQTNEKPKSSAASSESSSTSTKSASKAAASSVSKKSLKNPPVPQPKIPSSGKTVSNYDKFYIYLNHGRIVPFKLGREAKSSDRLGPYTKLSGDQEKFKAEYNPATGKFHIAYSTSKQLKGATRVIISKDGKVLQRGLLTSPKSAISWDSLSESKDQLYGKVQVLFAVSGESSFQVTVLNLPRQPFQWSAPPKKAVAVMRRITDAVSIYVPPISFSSPIRNTTAPISSTIIVKSVIVRAQNQALALANSFRLQTQRPIQQISTATAAMNHKVVKALKKYQGDVIVAVRGKPRKSIKVARERARFLKKRFGRVSNSPRCNKKRAVQQLQEKKHQRRRGALRWREQLLA